MNAALALVALPLLLFAGCATPASDLHSPKESQTLATAALPASFEMRGTYWLPPSTSAGMERGEVAFMLNASGSSLRVDLHLGNRLVGSELPASGAMLAAAIVDSANHTVGSAMVMAPQRDAQIIIENLTAGAYRLDLETRGGSDGAANGDYVAYAIRAGPRQG